MFYVIEAIRLDAAGEISHVRWWRAYRDARTGETGASQPEVVGVVEAVDACHVSSVHCYAQGKLPYVRTKVLPTGRETLQDLEDTEQGKRLRDLPRC